MLLVGGPADGRRLWVDGPKPYIDIAIPPKTEAALYHRDGRVNDEYTEVRYEAHRVVVCGRDLYVYAIEGMSDYEVLERLLDRYPKEAE